MFNKYFNRKESKDVNKNKFHFEKLSPTDELSDKEVYKGVLDFALDSDDILNIAITGPYSSGKSSLVNTFKKTRSEKFMHISLARFKTNQASNDEFDNSTLEGKVLNQILHQINPRKISKTNFKTKKKTPLLKLILYPSLLLTMILLMAFIIGFQKWNSIIAGMNEGSLKANLLFTTTNEFMLGVIFVLILLTGYSIYIGVKKQLNQPFLKRVRLEKYEIEMFDKDKETSYFDKHLDDILYLFENSGQNIFVFEDIDRYELNEIFGKLREINFLINVRKNRKIKFIYLLKDEVFTTKDRTKFFDIIVPTIPVIDSSNSFQQLKKIFEEGEIFIYFDPLYLERVSLYIDDMRILKNIYNEYLIYHESLKITKLKSDKLLAIIIYKNLFPYDFSQLQYKRGHVYHIISNIDNLKQKRVHELNLIKSEIENKIKEIEEEFVDNIDDLEAIYINFGKSRFAVNNKDESRYKSRTEFIQDMKSNPNSIKNIYNHHMVSIDSYFDELLNNEEFQKRKNLVESKHNNSINNLESEIKEIEKKIRLVKKQKLKDVFSKSAVLDLFDPESKENKNMIKNHYYELIVYLLRNGYIDETYTDYLTFFYETDFTKADKIFLRSIMDEEQKEYDYELTKVKRVVQSLREGDFEQKEILNFYLLDYLLENDHDFLENKLKYIEQSKNFRFVFEYIDWTEFENSFVSNLNRSWIEIWSDLVFAEDVELNKKKEYLIKTIYYSDIKNISEMNIAECITNFIESTHDIMEIPTPDIERIINVLLELNVKFDFIDFDEVDVGLFKEIYNNNLYQLSPFMINLFLSKLYNVNDNRKLEQSNYTQIFNLNEDEPIKVYVENNIDEYLYNHIIQAEIIEDTPSAAIDILNNDNIGDENKELYLGKSTTFFEDINSIPEKYWPTLLSKNLIGVNPQNIIRYSISYTVAGELIEYLNKVDIIVFDHSLLLNDFTVDNLISFYNQILVVSELDDEMYEEILRESNIEINDISSFSFEVERVRILINLKIITLNLHNYLYVQDEHFNLLIDFISININDFISLLGEHSEEVLSKDTILSVLDASEIDDKMKIEMLSFYQKPISIDKIECSELVFKYLLKNNFETSDLSIIIDLYSESSPTIKEDILEVITGLIDHVIEEGIFIGNQELLDKLIRNNEFSKEARLSLLLVEIKTLGISETKKYLQIIKATNYLGLFEGKNPTFEMTPLNDSLLTVIKEKGWINNYREDENKKGYYRAFGRKL